MPSATPTLERRWFRLPRHAIAVGIVVLVLIVAEVRWQDSFDAVVEGVFTVQGEIASRVAGRSR